MESSKQEFNRYKESKLPPPSSSPAPPVRARSAEPGPARSYAVQPPPLPGSSRSEVLASDPGTRSIRTYSIFRPYSTRPMVVYRDSYNSLFWWWLLDRSIEERAYWAYHHRHDMDPARYQALVTANQELETRVSQMEAQQVPRDTNYAPSGLDRNLMYTGQSDGGADSNSSPALTESAPSPASGDAPVSTAASIPAVTEAAGPEPANHSGPVPSYRVQPPPIPASSRHEMVVPDAEALATRSARSDAVFGGYSTRPAVVYRDPYSSPFWWWLLDRPVQERAAWAYHHRDDMDPARYQALVAADPELEIRVNELEAQTTPRDPNYVPPGVDRDLMFSDQSVERAYCNRPTTVGIIAFWSLGVPLALAVGALFIWLIWFKRWPSSTVPA